MPVETESDRLAMLADFGTSASYASAGETKNITGIFDNNYYESDPNSEAVVASATPNFFCRTSDIPADAKADDTMIIGAVNYTVVVHQTDGTGMTRVILQKGLVMPTTHVRKQIRDKLATILTGLTTTSTRVFKTRVLPLEPAKLPCLLIYTIDEQSAPDIMGIPRGKNRELSAVIEGVAVPTVGTSLDDTLDKIALEVENALENDITLNGLVKDCILTATAMNFVPDGEKTVGSIRMVWNINYRTSEKDATTAK